MFNDPTAQEQRELILNILVTGQIPHGQRLTSELRFVLSELLSEEDTFLNCTRRNKLTARSACRLAVSTLRDAPPIRCPFLDSAYQEQQIQEYEFPNRRTDVYRQIRGSFSSRLDLGCMLRTMD